jgi:hypothetical protein
MLKNEVENKMIEFGVALYPDDISISHDIKYLEMVRKYNFSELFLCLFSAENLENSKRIINIAKEMGFFITADIHFDVFKDHGLNYEDISFIKEIGLDAIRLDKGFSGFEEAMMTYNDFGIFIDLNISSDYNIVEKVLNYRPRKSFLRASHNYYPKDFTGLSEEYYIKSTSFAKLNGLKTSGFIFSQNGDFSIKSSISKTPMLEMHRNFDIVTQAKHLINMELSDKIIIGNCYAKEDEIKKLSELEESILSFDIIPMKGISDKEKEYLEFPLYTCRGDNSVYTIRTLEARKKIKNICVKNNSYDINRGDIFIDNENSEGYEGELSIALKNIKNNGNMNVLARVKEEEIFMLKYLDSWKKFNFNFMKGNGDYDRNR